MAAGQEQWSLARPPVAAERDEATPDWLVQIEHGRRWQQASESGKMLPPEPAVPMMLRAASGRGALVDFSAMPGAELEPGNVSLRATMVEGEPVSPPADDRVPIAETVLPAVAGSREGSPLLPPERSGPAERSLALQGAPKQNARQLAQQVQVMVSQDLQEADIRLSPSELGGLRIQLKMEQGEVNIQFLASQPQARELLDQALPRLREMLVQQGLTLGQGQVGGFNGQQGAQQQAAGGERGDRGEPGSAATEGNGSPELADVEPSGTRLAADGRIDFFA
ncbi:flagellar hook-length control protein FliK [Zobellella denitrificans]